MVDPLSNQVAQQAANQAAGQNGNPPADVEVFDQSQFEEAMNRSADNRTENTSGDANPGNGENNSEVTLGDAILNGLEKMKSTHDARSQRIEEQLTATDGNDLSVQDCIKLQFEVMQMSMEQELTGKIADKTSQGVQTLFKNQ